MPQERRIADNTHVSTARERALAALEERLGHRFANRELLLQALTHASRANEDESGRLRDNETLEFLGDSVLGFVVADMLHRRDPEGAEGVKTRARAHLVSTRSLARRARELGLPALIEFGRGEEKTGGRTKPSLWADAFEALLAALYLDAGLEAARRFVSEQFETDIAQGQLDRRDHKSALQELLQARGGDPPVYVVAAEEGPSHRRRYRVACQVADRTIAEGSGYSKKEAQQAAARDALAALRSDRAGDP
jgi:ribonuclease-3